MPSADDFEWEATTRRFGGVHPHHAAEVVVLAIDEQVLLRRAPRYLIDLRDYLNLKFPIKTAEQRKELT